MAVAGYENTLTLYSLKSMEQMRHEVEMEENLRYDAFMPIKGVCSKAFFLSMLLI